jgi:hypothetical protein
MGRAACADGIAGNLVRGGRCAQWMACELAHYHVPAPNSRVNDVGDSIKNAPQVHELAFVTPSRTSRTASSSASLFATPMVQFA